MLNLGRALMGLGLILFVTGAVFYLLGRSGFNAEQFPGNIRIERGNFTCIIGLGLSVVLSILLTVILNLVVRFLNK
jgi:hypothetical protein